MTAPPRPAAADDGLRFFGRVTASVSHDLNNVNSTIEQVLGLLEDHLAAAERGGAIDPARLLDVHARALRQTRRATGIIQRLNRFAHTADDPDARFDLLGLLADLVAVGERLAARRRVGLIAPSGGAEIEVRGDPFLLAQAVFAGLSRFWDAAPVGAELTVAADVAGDAPRILMSGPPPEDAAVDPAEAMAPYAARLGAGVDRRLDGGRLEIILALPAAPR